jgi:hypothetical protein
MIYLRQSTASQEIILGPFVDSTDGNTAETALTINNTDIKLWMTGATTLANKNSGGATHISGGIYYAVLDATDTATIGPLVVIVHVAGALAVRVPCVVLDEAVYDVQFGTVAPATISNITGGTITTATNVTTVNGLAANAITAAAIATNAIDADALAADAVTEIAAGITIPSAASNAAAVWNADATGFQTQGSFGQAIGDPAADTNTIYGAVVTGATGATIAADIITIDDFLDLEIAAIKAKTDNLPADPADASDIAASFSTVNTAIDALPTNAELATALAGADDPVLAAIAALNNLSMANIRTALGLGSANLDTQLADLPTNAELATALAAVDDAILTAIAALNNLSAAQVNAEVVDALTVDVIADSTPALGSRPTIAQAALLLTRIETEREVSGTTVTVNKEDHTTAAITMEMDDATNPTLLSRDS